MNDQNQANVDSDQVATQPVQPTASTPPSANEDPGTPIADGLQQPKDPNEDEQNQTAVGQASVASHNVFAQNQNPTDPSQAGGTDNVYAVDGDDPASIDEALKKHHEAHGA